MRRRIYKLLSVALIACMMFTSSGISAYAESDGEVLDVTTEVHIGDESVSDNDVDIDDEQIDVVVSENDVITNMDLQEIPEPMQNEKNIEFPSSLESISLSGGVADKINQLRQRYDTGSYFSVNGQACGHGQKATCTNCQLLYIDANVANVCLDGWTCCAFARYVFYNLFGMKVHEAGNKQGDFPASQLASIAKPGDFIDCYSTSNTNVDADHYAIFLGVVGNTLYLYESNVEHANRVSYAAVEHSVYEWATYRVFHANNYDSINGISTSNTFSYNVIGTTGRGSVSDTNATLYAKLATNVRSGLQVGIQIGTSSGNYNKVNHIENVSDAGYAQLNSSGEMEVWYECNNELGVSLTKGTKYYYRFVVTYNGQTYYSAENSFTTTGDTQKPSVSNLKVVSKDRNGYTLQVNVADNVGVTKVQFSTCTVASGKTDWKHYEVTDIKNGVATCTIKTSDFNNRDGKYCTDIYAYDAAGNRSDWNASATYYPVIDRTAPVVVSGEITSVDDEGYTVTATATDNVGVTAIQFPTWAENDSEEDIIWYEGTKVADGTYTCRIDAKDFNYRKGHFCTDIRAYDADGNVSEIKYGVSRLPLDLDIEKPIITNVQSNRISEDTVEISCQVTDNIEVTQVSFPTWTTKDGQDDLASDWWNACAGEKEGNIWKFRVKDSEHNFEKSGYITQIYAKDKYNNEAVYDCLEYDIENRFSPITFTFEGHVYEIYDDLLTWNQAKENCEQMGGHLATITSQEEQDAITCEIQSCVRDSFYIGGVIGEDTWITGESIDYTNWEVGQPDNKNGTEDIYEIFNKQGKWNDSNSNIIYGRGFICEYESEDDKSDVPTEEIPEDGIPEGLWVSGLDTDGYTYTGEAIKPAVKVYNHNKLLTEKVDYTITYKNNKKVYTGDDNAKKPQIIVTGKGNYAGKEYVYFDILPKNIGDSDVEMADIIKVYNGKKQNAIPTLVYNGKKLTYNKNAAKSDFTVSYSVDGDCKEAGEYVITVEGRGNYTGTNSCKYTIVENKLISKANVSITKNIAYNGGEPVFPTKLVVKYNKKTLSENEDYSVEYFNNCEIGKATAVITGLNGYSGTKKVTYNITGRKMSNAKVTGIVSKDYNGNAQTQEVTLTYNKEPMTQGEDYTVSYLKNVSAGTATIIFTGINGYTGTLKKTYKINPYSIKNNPDAYFANDGSDISMQYVKAGAKPDVTVTFKGKTLVKGVDYTLSYKNNTAVNDGTNPQKLPTITIKGKGNFKDFVTKTFAITPGDLGREGVKMKASDKVYKKQKNAYKSTPVLYDTNGKKLAAGTDYSKKYVYRYNDKNGAVIGTNEIPEAGSIIYVEAAGIKNYEGSTIGTTYRIVKQGISSAKVSVESQTYTGKAITITKDDIKSIKIGKTALTQDDYEIVPNSYKNNIKKGTASVNIRGVGNYGGEKKITFKIKAKSLLFDWSWLFG